MSAVRRWTWPMRTPASIGRSAGSRGTIEPCGPRVGVWFMGTGSRARALEAVRAGACAPALGYCVGLRRLLLAETEVNRDRIGERAVRDAQAIAALVPALRRQVVDVLAVGCVVTHRGAGVSRARRRDRLVDDALDAVGELGQRHLRRDVRHRLTGAVGDPDLHRDRAVDFERAAAVR